MDVFRSEIKVGLLIVVAAALFAAALLLAGGTRLLGSKRKTLVLHFPYADGITKGSPVWYAGFEVGEVSDIGIVRGDTDRIAVTVRIRPEVQVRVDSKVAIRSLGMMGARHVEMSPGSPGASVAPDGGVLEGEASSSLSEVMEAGRQAAVRIAQLAGETQEFIREIRTEASIRETVQNTNGLMADMRDQVKDLKPLLVKLSAFVDSLNESGKNLKRATLESGKDMTSLFKELRETNRDFQKRLGALEGRIAQTLVQVEKTFSDAGDAARGVRGIVRAGEEDVASMLRHLDEAARNLDAMSDDLRAHPWKVLWKERGEKRVSGFVGTDEWREKGRIGPHGRE